MKKLKMLAIILPMFAMFGCSSDDDGSACIHESSATTWTCTTGIYSCDNEPTTCWNTLAECQASVNCD